MQNIKFRYGGFSILELIISIAIIMSVIGMAGYGINIARRSSRDAQRRQVVRDISIALQKHNDETGWYPTDGMVGAGNESLLIGAGATYPGSSRLLAKGAINPDSETTTMTTRYCYSNYGKDGYRLGALMENGDWYYLNLVIGTDTSGVCEDISL